MSFILSFSLIEINSFTLFFSLSFIQVAQSSPSPSADSVINRPRFVEDEHEKADPSSHSTNGDFVVGIEGVDAKPDRIVLSDAAKFPTTSGLGKRGLNRRIANHDEEEEDSHQGPVPDSAKSQNDKSTSKKKRNVPPVKFEPPDEESTTDEDAEPTRYFVFYVFHSIILFHFCFL